MKEFLKLLQEKDSLKPFKFLLSATSSFLFLKKESTKGQTHIRDGMDLKRIMITVYLALLPATLMGIFNIGYQAYPYVKFSYTNIFYLDAFLYGCFYFLPLYLLSFLVGGFWEIFFATQRKHEVNEGFLVTSLLFPLTLPPTLPLWQAALGISFAIVVGKEIFGGTGKNIFNPALLGRAFLFFAYPSYMSGDRIWIAADGVTSATSLAKFALNESVTFSSWQAFLGLIPGSIGEVSKLACLLGALYLFITGVASYRIILGSVLGFLFITSIFYFFGSTSFMLIGPWQHFLYGSFCFATIFMATDPVSASFTKLGQWIYGFFIGLIGIIIRVVNPAYPEGFMLAILFMNIFAPLLDYLVLRHNMSWRKKLYEK